MARTNLGQDASSSPVEAILQQQVVSLDCGLTEAEAGRRQAKFGPNSLTPARRINPLMLFLNQFKDVLVIILLISALVSWGVGLLVEPQTETHQQDPTSLSQCADDSTVSACSDTTSDNESGQEALLIFVIVLAIALIGFFNEYKAEKTVEALKQLVGHKAVVRRGGQVVSIDAGDLVPGDIILLEEGAKVPADARLAVVNNLHINEASLTGESLPVNKNGLVGKPKQALGDQKNMAFAGTFVTQGTAVGVVVKTAQATELGKIAQLVNEVEVDQTPMQHKLDDLGKKLGLIILLICLVVFVVVFLFVDSAQNQTFIQRAIFALTAAVALAVAAIPEGLAFVVRISLALGARRMAAKQALVRRLSAVEALGSTDIICSDKTGTLTKGEMTVRALYVDCQTYRLTGTGYKLKGDLKLANSKVKPTKLVSQLLRLGSLCNNAHLKGDSVIGDPTELALTVSAAKVGIDQQQLQRDWQRFDEIPFTSERKLMTVVVKQPKADYLLATKGAVERVLDNCSHILTAKAARPITDKDKTAILAQNQRLASQALRVLAFAYKQIKDKPPAGKTSEQGLTFVGLQAMMDPPREEVKQVINQVQTNSGLRVIMITGDYIETAKAVAKEIGINGRAVSGADIEKMSQAEFEKQVEQISVYARVNPEHKIRIVKALKGLGHQVAMTGDGVNDAPAIKAADIGIAMGITGTDASKEAADLILLDDQFLTIIAAIEEGRGIFDNVRKFVNFLISCNIAEVLAVLAGILVFNNLILTAAQLLFINIVTDGLPAIALGSDPSHAKVLNQKPQYYQGAILNRRIWAEIFIFGVLMTVALLIQYWYNLDHGGVTAAVSAAFTAMVIYELVRLVDIRTEYSIPWFSNPWLSVAILSSVILQLAVLFFTPLANYFKVIPLQAHDWLFMLVASLLLILIMKALNPVLDKAIGREVT